MKTVAKRFEKYFSNTPADGSGGTGSPLMDGFFDNLEADDNSETKDIEASEIKQLALFNNIDEEKLVEIVPFFSKKSFKKDTLILEQYEENKNIIIFDQKVHVLEKNTQSAVNRMEWIFGDETFSAQEPPSKDIILLEDHTGYVISIEDFSKALRLLPDSYKNLLYFTAKRLREERRESVYLEDELNRKNRLLLNINQPWLEINSRGEITSFHSQKAIRCLGFHNLKTIEGKNFFNMIYKESPRQIRIEEKKKNQGILKEMFVSNSDIMASLLPAETKIDDNFYNITYDPICEKKDSGQKRITTVLIILKDITVDKQLAKIQDEEQKAEKARIARNTDPIGYINMIKQVKKVGTLLDQYNFEVFENQDEADHEFLGEIMRHLHTAKGMSGFFIVDLKNTLHELEDYFRQKQHTPAKIFLNLRHQFSDQLKTAIHYMEELGDTLLHLIKGFSYTPEEQKELMAGLYQLQHNTPIAQKLYRLVSQKLKAPASELVKGWQEDIDRMTIEEQDNDNYGKAIDVSSLIQEDLHIHRLLIENLGGILKHIYRNSVAHGIEPPEIREKIGKPEVGQIKVKIWEKAQTLKISIQDDGKGVDANEIKNIALKKQIITPAEAEHISKQEIINLIFKPGFSTMKKVTDVAGRGVGMDAVYNVVVKKLKGKVSFGSRFKKGSRILLEVPLAPFENRF